jgi:predicted dehydrogenase
VSDAPLRVGLIGAGRWAPALIRTLRDLPDCTLARIARAKAGPVPGAPETVEITTDWRRVAEADDLDAALIATPPRLHAEMTAACIRRGLPAFVEKPLTLSAQEARTLVELAERQQPIVFVDHINLFNPAFRALRDAVRGRAPLDIETEAGATPDQPIHDYGVLWDWGSHDVAMALTLTERRMPIAVAARRTAVRSDGRETVEFALTFDSGTRSRHVVGNLWDKRRRALTVRCEDEAWRFDDLAERKFAHTVGTRVAHPEIPADPPLKVALSEFARAVRAGRPDFEQLRLGARVVEVLAQCEEAMRASA